MKKEIFNKEVNKFKNYVKELILTCFLEEKHVQPSVFALTYEGEKDGNHIFGFGIMPGLEQLFTSDEGKEQVGRIIREGADKVKPIAIAFVSEAWAVIGDKEKNKEEYDALLEGKIHPSNHPDKKEVLFISTETYAAEHVDSWVIIRKDKDVTLDKFDMGMSGWHEKSDVKAKFQGLLQECYVTFDDEKEIIKN